MEKNSFDFEGSRVLVTGGTSGIGKATAIAFARHGAQVLISGRDAKRGDAVVEAIKADGGSASFLQADLSDAESTRSLARRALEIGPINVLVNNAGVFPFGSTAETNPDAFQEVFATNVWAPFILVGELAPKMAERGSGAIVNVSSMVGDFGVTGMALYGSSKAAINLLTKAWTAEFGPHGVRVNAVSPGPTRTEGTAVMDEAIEQFAAMAPAGRPAAPQEIADAILYLASDRATFVNGVVLSVDGGRAAT
jgi:NAD(P)-dependent dehydrogenase (short-subunit alcohol dehydrogenase family)